MTVRVVLVDDEAPARRELARLLAEIPGAEVVASVGSATRVMATLAATPCDLVLLDIRMPDRSGLELASEILTLDPHPHVAFVSAHGDHALEAFEREALDYVLKPATRERLERVLERVRSQGSPAVDLDRLVRSLGAGEAPMLVGSRPGSDRRVLLRPARVLFVEARDEVVLLVTREGEYVSQRSLKQLEGLLAESGFVRTHRSFLVNLDEVREFEPEGGGGCVLYLDPPRFQVPVSRRAWPELRSRLERT